jgi:hypothetical protein
MLKEPFDEVRLGWVRNRRTEVRLMWRRREMALLFSPFFESALTCEAYFATVGGRPCAFQIRPALSPLERTAMQALQPSPR